MSEYEKLPTIAQGIVWRLLDDNAVLVSPREGEVRVLNAVGTTIWQLLVDNHDVPSIEDYLNAHYDVTLEHARTDLSSFLEELTDRGILVWNQAKP